MKNLQTLVMETNSKIVIDSTKRKDEEEKSRIIRELKKYELGNRLMGFTPCLGTTRGEEIQAFLDSLEEKPNFIIIDDNSDMGKLQKFLILTDAKIGLSEKDVEEGIKRLARNIDKMEDDFER